MNKLKASNSIRPEKVNDAIEDMQEVCCCFELANNFGGVSNELAHGIG